MSRAHALRRFTRHDFNRAAWLKARRSERFSPASSCLPSMAPVPAEPVPPPAAPAPRRLVKLDLAHAPSAMEVLAASWGQRHA